MSIGALQKSHKQSTMLDDCVWADNLLSNRNVRTRFNEMTILLFYEQNFFLFLRYRKR